MIIIIVIIVDIIHQLGTATGQHVQVGRGKPETYLRTKRGIGFPVDHNRIGRDGL
ncbi:hypothetical protein D3C87_1706990 [compost metagenome]